MRRTNILFDNFMSRADMQFKTFGLVINIKLNQKPESVFLRVFYFVSIFNLLLVLSSETTFIVISLLEKQHFLAVTMNFCCIGFGGVAIIKVFIIKQKMTKLLALQQRLREMFPKNSSEQLSYNVSYFLQFYNRISLGYVIIHMLLIWCFNLSALFVYLVKHFLLQIEGVEATLSYACFIPWNWEGNWTYYFIYFVLCFGGQTCMSAQLGSDLLFFANCTQLIMHYRYLGKTMLQFVPVEKHQQNRLFLNQFISKHQKLLSLSNSLNDVFGLSILVNFISSAGIMCFLGFQLTVGVETYIIVMLLLFLTCSLLQAFMISSFGQQLQDASCQIADAVYKQDWIHADLSYKKTMIVIIGRAQKPAILKATVFLEVTMETFAMLLQISYKCFALLRLLYAK